MSFIPRRMPENHSISPWESVGEKIFVNGFEANWYQLGKNGGTSLLRTLYMTLYIVSAAPFTGILGILSKSTGE